MVNQHIPYGIYEKYFKRLLDIFCCLVILFLFGWLYVIIAILIKVRLGGPILFKQKRPGKNEKIFMLYKFRTMTNACDENGNPLPDEMRLTKLGKILRLTSLDELPEIFNILKGEMSLIGPRPLLVQYLPYYNIEERHRHDVRPGLSGLAQVNGRNFIDWDHRLALDVQYVNKITFIGDMHIIFRTILKLVRKEDVAVDTNKVEPNFADERRSKMSKEVETTYEYLDIKCRDTK